MIDYGSKPMSVDDILKKRDELLTKIQTAICESGLEMRDIEQVLSVATKRLVPQHFADNSKRPPSGN